MAKLDVITETLQSMDKRMSAMEVWQTAVDSRMQAVEGSAASAATRLSGVEATLKTHSATIEALCEFQNNAAASLMSADRRIEVLKTRLWSANLRIVGIPALAPGADLQVTVQAFLRREMLGDINTDRGALKRVQRLRTQGATTGSVPGSGMVIAVFLNGDDRESILRAASSMPPLMYESSRVYLYPDVSREVAQRRSAFCDIRKQFVDCGFSASVRFPARLTLRKGSLNYMFTGLKAAQDFLADKGGQSADT